MNVRVTVLVVVVFVVFEGDAAAVYALLIVPAFGDDISYLYQLSSSCISILLNFILIKNLDMK